MTILESDLESKKLTENTDWQDVIMTLVKKNFNFEVANNGEQIRIKINGDVLILQKDKVWGFSKGDATNG